MKRAKKAPRRITPRPHAPRNTSSPAAEPMRASKQLDAFPTSDNAKRRQSSNKKAVVSIRLSGATIARLDDEAKRARVTRSDVIERALAQHIKAGAS